METAIVHVPRDGVDGLIANLERTTAALAECIDNAQRLYIRDHAHAAQAAAAVLKRRDIETAASLLVNEAERAIAKASPPQQGQRNDLRTYRFVNFDGEPIDQDDFVPPEHEVPGLRKMRQAHRQSDEEWEGRKAEAMATQTPITRAGLIQENRNKGKPKSKTKTKPLTEFPQKTSRRLPGDGGKVEVRIFPDGGVTVERLGFDEWVVSIAPDGLIREATATGAADTAYAGRLLKLPEVRRLTGLGKTTIYRKIRAGEFPAQFKTGDRSVVWRADQISEWMKRGGQPPHSLFGTSVGIPFQPTRLNLALISFDSPGWPFPSPCASSCGAVAIIGDDFAAHYRRKRTGWARTTSRVRCRQALFEPLILVGASVSAFAHPRRVHYGQEHIFVRWRLSHMEPGAWVTEKEPAFSPRAFNADLVGQRIAPGARNRWGIISSQQANSLVVHRNVALGNHPQPQFSGGTEVVLMNKLHPRTKGLLESYLHILVV